MQSSKLSKKQNKILGIFVFSILTATWIYFSFSDLRKVVTDKYPDQVVVLIGAYSDSNGESKVEARSYILLPSVFMSPVIISVIRVNESKPTLSERPLPAWFLLVSIGFLLIGLVNYRRKRNT